MQTNLLLQLMAGIPIPIRELQLTISQPKIKDIAYMGETEFFSAMQYICINKESVVQDKSVLQVLTNFQVFMKVLQTTDIKNAINNLLALLFPDYACMIIPGRSILFSSEEIPEPILIDDNNFDILQSYMKEVLCVNSLLQGDNIVYKPANEAAQRIANKIMEGRRKIAQIKSKENAGTSILTRYISILTIGTNTLSIQDCLDLTLFQLFDLVERYTAWVNWDTDLRLRLAGGKPDKEVETWMKDLYHKT